MMDAASAATVVTAMEALAKIVNSLGVGGVLALLLLWPVLFTAAVLAIMVWANLKLSRLLDTYRSDMASQVIAYREDMGTQIAVFRADMAQQTEAHRVRVDAILREYGRSQEEVSQYYKNNVELLKTTQGLADDLQDVVLLNTRTCEAMSEKIKNNQFCPVARRNSGGE